MNFPPLLLAALICASVSNLGVAADLPALGSARSVASLPPSPAAAARRILLVDDDVSENNYKPGDPRLSPSDRVFRQLVANAVGGDSAAWDIETVKAYASGPNIERLRPFSIIIWYTGSSYGGNPDNTAVLSVEDEKTVCRYLEDVGGTVILISPGYLGKALDAGSTNDKANWPFLTEVLGVRGGVGLAKRFEAGIVKTSGGAQFEVGKGSATIETQFSSIKPDVATVVFTSSLAPTKGPDATVASSNSHGRGRIIYVGFTFENLADAALAPAFQTLLAAAAPPADPTVALVRPPAPLVRQPLAANPEPTSVHVGGTALRTTVSWTLPSAPIDASTPFSAQSGRHNSRTPDPGLTVKVERWKQYVTLYGESYAWEAMPVQPGASQVVDPYAQPGSTQRYRVSVTNGSGATGFKEVEYNVPPIQDPKSLSANIEGDGSVLLTWPEVPGVTRYLVQFVAPTHGYYSPHVVVGATQYRSEPNLDGGKKYWAVTSLYEQANGEYASMTTWDTWPQAITESIDQFYLTNATFTIQTGNDNKELLSRFEIQLYINGGQTNTDGNPNYAQINPHNLQEYGGVIFGSKDVELKVNSSTEFSKTWRPDTVWMPGYGNLVMIQRYGLRIVIKYFPNFFTDAWKIDGVTLTVSFQDRDQFGSKRFSPGMENKTITFLNVGKLLTERANRVDLIIDGFLMPVAVE